MLFASTIGQIGHPFYVAFAYVLAAIYAAIPNYAIAIALLTILVMIIVFPITLKGTRGMMKMQLLAPELKKIQNRHKTTPGMTVQERQDARKALNDEMMALYRENNTSPTGGCLPLFLQMPMFLILYGTIRGLTHETTTKLLSGATVSHADPLYVSKTSKIYLSIIHSNGALNAFGINLAHSVKSPGSLGQKIPFILLILAAVALQYLQMKQLSGRNPAARQANPQMQQMQKVFPLIFAVIYISIPAGVNVYFIVSSLFRVGQQEFMYRRDPELQAAMHQLRQRTSTTIPAKAVDTTAAGAPRGAGILGRLRPTPALQAGDSVVDAPKSNGSPKSPNRPAAGSNGRTGSNARKGQANRPPAKPVQPRAEGKRPRRPR